MLTNKANSQDATKSDEVKKDCDQLFKDDYDIILEDYKR